MSTFKLIALGSAAIIAMHGPAVFAADNDFTSHQKVKNSPYEAYAEQLPAEKKLGLREYLNYESREPCQFYQPVPEGFVRDGCDLRRTAPQHMEQVSKPRAPQQDLRVSNVLNDYEVNFAFDSALIEPAAGNTLDQAAEEIQRYSPREVTVAGYTDKAGPSDYNVDLSKRRAQVVSDALNERGVANRIIDEEAYGESHPAVDTRDGVALRENRRVVVEFRK